jgi:hypothetical protein
MAKDKFVCHERCLEAKILPEFISYPGETLPIQKLVKHFMQEKNSFEKIKRVLKLIRNYVVILSYTPFNFQNQRSYFGSLRIHSTHATLAPSLFASRYDSVYSDF